MTTRIVTEFGGQRWLDCYNATDETILPFACVYIASAKFPAYHDLPKTLTRVVFPIVICPFADVHYFGVENEIDEFFSIRSHQFAFNGPGAIEPGSSGLVTKDCPTYALVRDTDTGGLLPTTGSHYDSRICLPMYQKQWLGSPNLSNSLDTLDPTSPPADYFGFIAMARVPERIVGRVTADANVYLINRFSATQDS